MTTLVKPDGSAIVSSLKKEVYMFKQEVKEATEVNHKQNNQIAVIEEKLKRVFGR